MLETASHPVAAQSKVDHKIQRDQLNLSVTSERPSVVELPTSQAVVEPAPNVEPKDLSEKVEEPIAPSPPPLLILDLNGCILYREYVPGSAKIIKPRPHLDELFEYILAGHPKDDKVPNWELMIWSSAQPNNVELMLQAIAVSKRPQIPRSARRGPTAPKSQLNDISNRMQSLAIDKTNPESTDVNKKSPPARTAIDIWARDTLDLSSEDYGRKVSTTKDLRKVWDKFTWTDPSTGDKLKWGAHNTVIVDDSPDKLSLQPDNLCMVNEFKGNPNDTEILDLIEKLKRLRDESNMPEAIKKMKEKKN